MSWLKPDIDFCPVLFTYFLHFSDARLICRVAVSEGIEVGTYPVASRPLDWYLKSYIPNEESSCHAPAYLFIARLDEWIDSAFIHSLGTPGYYSVELPL